MTTEYLLIIAALLISAIVLRKLIHRYGTKLYELEPEPSEFHSRDRYRVAEDYANMIDDARNSQLAKLQRKINKEALKADENETQIFLRP